MTTPSASTSPVAPRFEAPEPLHACIRCGRPGLPADKALCEDCNPLELAQPSATQMHGIAAVGIVAFVAILAVLGRAALAGTGPFVGQVGAVAATSGGLSVTLSVANQGSKAGETTCRIVAKGNPAGGASELVQTPSIAAGQTVTFSSVVTRLGTDPIALDADCQSP